MQPSILATMMFIMFGSSRVIEAHMVSRATQLRHSSGLICVFIKSVFCQGSRFRGTFCIFCVQHFDFQSARAWPCQRQATLSSLYFCFPPCCAWPCQRQAILWTHVLDSAKESLFFGRPLLCFLVSLVLHGIASVVRKAMFFNVDENEDHKVVRALRRGELKASFY